MLLCFCSVGAPWKSTLTLSCIFFGLIPSAAPGEQRKDSDASVGMDTMLQRCKSLYVTQDPQQTRIRPQLRGWIHKRSHKQRAPMRENRLCQVAGIPNTHAQDNRFHQCLVQDSPFPQTSSSSSTQQCPSLLVSPQTSLFKGTKIKQKAELTPGVEHPGLALLPGLVGHWSWRLPPLPLQS